MTIAKGEPWGEIVACPTDLLVVDDDAALQALVDRHRRAGDPIPDVGLRGGDLFRAVGGTVGADRLVAGEDVALLPCDVLRVTVDERVVWGAVHVVARRPLLGSAALGWWRGAVLAAMNAQYLGPWDVAPRCHPNDGRADIVVVAASMRVGDRWKARSRAHLGTHVPHPSITTRQAREIDRDLDPGTRVWVDGVPMGSARHLAVAVEPDAFRVLV